MENKLKKIIPIILITTLFSRQLDVQFFSDIQWLLGMPVAGGEAFNNGVMYGMGLYGNSTLDVNDAINVDIHLSTHADSQSVAYVFSAENLGAPLDVGQFPGMVWDVSNPQSPRRLNVCFFERNDGDRIWNPTTVTGMDLEYLLIMDSDYDESGQYYADMDITNSDVHYFSWFRRYAGQDWFASEPAILEYRNFWEFSHFDVNVDESSATLEWTHENPEIEASEIENYVVKVRQSEDEIWETEVLANTIHEYTFSNLNMGEDYHFQVCGLNSIGEEIVQSEIIISTPMPIASNTTLLAHWDGADESLVGASNYNDVWGFTAEDGTEFALIGQWNGTSILDISTDEANPTFIDFIPGSYSSHRDIKSYGNFIYIGTEANRPDPYIEDFDIIEQGVQVVDMTNPYNPQLVNEWDGVVQSHNLMSEDDPYLYVLGSTAHEDSWGVADLIILDLTDPANPTKIGEWNGDYLHDICLDGDILYGMAIYADAVHAIDISDKTDPQLITSWDGIPSSHACWVSDDGETLFSASETSYGHIISWDVSNLNNVNMLDEWFPFMGEEWSVHNIFYKNGYIIASHYAFGLQIVDVRNPEDMQTAGFYDTYNYSDADLFDGAWGAFPYFDSNRIIVSDRSTGLYVIQFDEEGWNEPFIMGDINSDEVMDVLDVVMLVDYIMGNATFTNIQFFKADLNFDEIVNILDIMMMVYASVH